MKTAIKVTRGLVGITGLIQLALGSSSGPATYET